MSDKNPLIELYGENAFDLVLAEIKDVATHSNIPFDKKYVDLGVSFMMIKAKKLIEEDKPAPNLRFFVTESFGEAGIYKYNVAGGVL